MLSAAAGRSVGASVTADPSGRGVNWTAIVADPCIVAEIASLRTPVFGSWAGCGEVGSAAAAIVVNEPMLAGRSRARRRCPPSQRVAVLPSCEIEILAAVCMDHTTSVLDEE